MELKSIRNAIYPNLTDLTFKNNGLKQLNKRMMSLFPHLQSLSLAHNQIHSIEYQAFGSTENQYLKELNLERNKLRRVNRNMFVGLRKLQVLILKENMIESIEDGAFKDLESLQMLDLTRNKITVLGERAFQTGLKSLNTLLLSYNPFKRIDKNAFKYLALEAQLKRLDLIRFVLFFSDRKSHFEPKYF